MRARARVRAKTASLELNELVESELVVHLGARDACEMRARCVRDACEMRARCVRKASAIALGRRGGCPGCRRRWRVQPHAGGCSPTLEAAALHGRPTWLPQLPSPCTAAMRSRHWSAKLMAAAVARKTSTWMGLGAGLGLGLGLG